jgi:16S rRNA (cytosine1402-N4)-methyltransferase
VAVIGEAVPARFRTKAIARIFQAIRIEVNGEIDLLEQGLVNIWKVLKVDGILCVISYHSIEDRRMKRFVVEKAKGCTCPPKLPMCVCGKKPSAKILTSSALRPTAKEMRLNPRSRSARLRAAVKIAAE